MRRWASSIAPSTCSGGRWTNSEARSATRVSKRSRSIGSRSSGWGFNKEANSRVTGSPCPWRYRRRRTRGMSRLPEERSAQMSMQTRTRSGLCLGADHSTPFRVVRRNTAHVEQQVSCRRSVASREGLWSAHELRAARAWRCGKTTPVCWSTSENQTTWRRREDLVIPQVDRRSSVCKRRQRSLGRSSHS
jgi:hypothetical protein